MEISNINNNNKGFTLTELIVVVAGLAILSSLAIPNVLNRIKINRTEEIKALMNGYASDCLGKFRVYDGNDVAAYLEETPPYGLDNLKLSSLGYKIDGDKNKCNHVALKPLNDDEKDLFAIDFRITDGLVLKTGTPSSNPAFLNSCRNWAGENCGLSEEQKREFERIAELAKAKSECLGKYSNWLNAGNSGEFVSWDNEKETCSSKVWAFEGRPVSSAEAVEQALNNKYGKACLEWRQSKIASNSISYNGNPESKSPECGGVNYWFHSGKEFTNKTDWIEEDNRIKKQACINDRDNARSNKSGEYTYEPRSGPDPCGKTVWLCKGIEYTSKTDYLTTSCGTPPGPPPPPPPPPRCANFKRNDVLCNAIPDWDSWHPLCICK